MQIIHSNGYRTIKGARQRARVPVKVLVRSVATTDRALAAGAFSMPS